LQPVACKIWQRKRVVLFKFMDAFCLPSPRRSFVMWMLRGAKIWAGAVVVGDGNLACQIPNWGSCDSPFVASRGLSRCFSRQEKSTAVLKLPTSRKASTVDYLRVAGSHKDQLGHPVLSPPSPRHTAPRPASHGSAACPSTRLPSFPRKTLAWHWPCSNGRPGEVFNFNHLRKQLFAQRQTADGL
jgi:hypothetical protein